MLLPSRPLPHLAAQGIAPSLAAAQAPHDADLAAVANSSGVLARLTAYQASGGVARGEAARGDRFIAA